MDLIELKNGCQRNGVLFHVSLFHEKACIFLGVLHGYGLIPDFAFTSLHSIHEGSIMVTDWVRLQIYLFLLNF